MKRERDSYRTNYSKDLDKALKAQSKLINEECTKQENLYKSQIKELNKRKPEVHHHHHSICKIILFFFIMDYRSYGKLQIILIKLQNRLLSLKEIKDL
jgi:hypothetical protein